MELPANLPTSRMSLPAIAYIISAYKYPGQLLRLVSRLQAEQTYFLIHYDQQASDAEFRQLVDGWRGQANVQLLERHPCHWGDFAHVRATLKGIAEIVRQQISCDYVVLLTGQDYPIKSNAEIRQFFAAQNGKSFMRYAPLAAATAHLPGEGLDRIERWHFRLFNRRIGFPLQRRFAHWLPRWLSAGLHAVLPRRRRFLAGFVPYGGSSYWCLSRQCIDYLHDFTTTHRQFVKFFRRVHVADELFFQTALLNSPLRESVVNDDLRYIVWPFLGAHHPAILTQADIPALKQSAALFARKFDMTADVESLNIIDREILGVCEHVSA